MSEPLPSRRKAGGALPRLTALDHVALHGIPSLPRSYLPRARLWDRLNVANEGAVTVLVAPVGAGKTLGVAGWLERTGRAADARWVTVTPELSLDDLAHLTRAPSSGSPPRLLVLDDAHLLSQPAFGYLDERLNRDPRTVRILLLTRWDLPLTRVVPELLGDLTVLRGDLLRLDDREVARLVAEHARTASTEVYEAISEWSRGWCAAAVLAARAVAASSDPVDAVRRLMPGTAVVDWATTEVFASLTARQRHVLLCVAGEPVVSASLARHLSRDEDAGQLLEDLESTGLLVSRYVETARDFDHDRADAQDDPQVNFRLHPVLAEMARRRLTAGGVDVERARSTVRRAVGLDLRQGVLRGALRRLLGVGAMAAAVRLLADQGVRLVLAGEAEEVLPLLRDHAPAIEAEPGSWFPVALHRWLAGDLVASRSWLQRLDRLARSERGVGRFEENRATWPLVHMCVDLMRARLGDAPLAEAVAAAEEMLGEWRSDRIAEAPLLSLALLHLGVAELQLGRFGAADAMLSRVVLQGKSTRLSAVTSGAAATMALSQLLQGREHAALDLAVEIPYDETNIAHPASILARELALLQSRLHIGESAVPVLAPTGSAAALHPTDRVGNALSRIHLARLLLLRGRVGDAERTLDSELLTVELPPPVHVLVLVEQALVAAVAVDPDRLSTIESRLDRAGFPGEAAFVAALCADVVGDSRTSIELCGRAVDLSTCAQPPVAVMARVVRSQLLDAQGERSEAQEELGRALSATELRRNALPFLGWSRHGTSVAGLLSGLPASSLSAWTEELQLGLADHPGGIHSVAGPRKAGERERVIAPGGVLAPNLSPREQDVLHELARGATYADIASNLFLSENTVKTHVSSLYAKLAVGRRSDALSVARTLRLL